MTLGIDGLVSGLDTTSLINSLIAAESGTQNLLKTKVTSTQTLVTDLQSLNSSVAALAANAKGASTVDKLSGVTTSSSAPSVTVTADATTTPGSLTFRVDRLAQSQVSVTSTLTSWAGGPTVTLVGSDGAKTEVAAGSSLADLVANLNKSATGVSATLAAAGTAAGGATQYRIQLTGASGAAGAFSLYDGSAADVEAGTATDVLAAPGAATVRAAQDAAVTLWAGSGAEQQITSATNTFTDLLSGVDATVSAVESSPVTVTVARSASTATTAANNLITGLNNILSTIKTKSSVTSATNADGSVGTSAGSFTGDSLVRQLSSQLSSAAMDPVNGLSPSTIGITITRTGAIQFDATAFGAAMASDPAGTQSMLATIAARIQSVAEGASDSTDGSITQRIAGEKSSISSLNEQISDWDTRLAARRATLQAQYTAMETALSSLKGQSDYLTQQLSSLNGSSK